MREILFWSLLVLVPAGLLAFIRPAGRRVFLVLGLAAGFGLGFVVPLEGPDTRVLVFSLLGFGVAAGALLVEGIGFVAGTIGRRRGRRQGG